MHVFACVCGQNPFFGVQIIVRVAASASVGLYDWYLLSKLQLHHQDMFFVQYISLGK